MLSALDVAKYIISYCNQRYDGINNLQLQKVLYFLQEEYLLEGKPLFYDKIEAWVFGPVVPNVYYQFCGFGANKINFNYIVEIPDIYLDTFNLLIDKYAFKPFWTLSKILMHKESAWYNVYVINHREHGEISNSLIKEKRKNRDKYI